MQISPNIGVVDFELRVIGAATATWLAAGLASLAMARSSAAMRHRVWSLAVVAVLLMPAMVVLMPAWRVGVTHAPTSAAAADRPMSQTQTPIVDRRPRAVARDTEAPSRSRSVVHTEPANSSEARATGVGKPQAADSTAQPPQGAAALTLAQGASAAPFAIPWRFMIAILWGIPAFLLIARQMFAIALVRRVAHRAASIDGRAADRFSQLANQLGVRRHPSLRESSTIGSPICIGWAGAFILLPDSWRGWPSSQLDAVLTHELAHISRRDVLWQFLARLACALYWFHPLVWVATWRMRVERELACDDWVLLGGESATRYARWLLDIAQCNDTSASLASCAAVAMAARGGLAHRVSAILDPRRRRGPVSRQSSIALGLAVAALLAAVSSISPFAPQPSRAQQTQSATSPPSTQPAAPFHVVGTVSEEDGRPAAGARIEIQLGLEYGSGVTDADGHFSVAAPSDRLRYGVIRAMTQDGTRQAVRLSGGPQTDQSPPIHLLLKPARHFDVSVNDAQGQPAPGVWVALISDYRTVGEATTDAAGKALLQFPADAKPRMVIAAKAEWGFDYQHFWADGQTKTDPYRLDQDYAGPITLKLSGATNVRLHVVDEQNRPLAGVHTDPWLFERPNKGEDANIGGIRQFHRITDARGIAEFPFVPADNLRPINFWARLEGYTSPERWTFDPKSGKNVVEVKLYRLLHVAGRVLDQDGKPSVDTKVLVGGEGYQFDDFRGEVKTDQSGKFAIDVDPEKFYLFTAWQGHRSAAVTRIIHSESPEEIELKLGESARIHGQVTAGPGNTPAAKVPVYFVLQDYDSYRMLPEDQRFPGGMIGRKSIIPHVSLSGSADEKGFFEFYSPPGHFYVSSTAGGLSVTQHSQVASVREIGINLHSEQAAPTFITGRVVRADQPNTSVAEAKVIGFQVDDSHNMRDPEGISDRDGRFTLRQMPTDLYIAAQTLDHKEAGLIIAKSGQTNLTVPVGPLASVNAKILEQDGSVPVVQSISAGIQMMHTNNHTFRNLLQIDVKSGADGSFELNGLLPGQEYIINVATGWDEGRPNRWFRIGRVTPPDTKRIELGDLFLPIPDVKKGWTDYMSEAFAATGSIEERLASAEGLAHQTIQNVLVLAGDPKSFATGEFFRIKHDVEETPVHQSLADFRFIAIDTTEDSEAARRWAQHAGVQWPAVGMTLAVFDPQGRLVAQTSHADLMKGTKFSDEKLIAFAKKYAPDKPDAQKLFDDALLRAKREGKSILFDEAAAWCGPCIKLGRYLEANHALLDKDFVCVTIDHRYPHAAEVFDRLAFKVESVPWIAILDADGKLILNSMKDGKNIGYPSAPAEKLHWRTMLQAGKHRLTDEEIDSLVKAL